MTPPAATAAGRAGVRYAPRAPRRVSGPARTGGSRSRSTGFGSRVAPAPGRLPGLLRRGRLLADSRLLGRLVSGRLWVPVVGILLLGIVFMQVSMLKLNTGIGRAVESATTLERQNSVLRADVSRMEAGGQIVDRARALHMVVPADGSTRYVTAGGALSAQRAALRMTAPNSDAIARGQTVTGQANTNAAATAPAQAVVTPTTMTSEPTTTIASTTSTTAPTTTTAAVTTATVAAPPATTSTPTTAAPTTAAPTTAAPTTAAPATAAPTGTVATAGGTAAPVGGQQ